MSLTVLPALLAISSNGSQIALSDNVTPAPGPKGALAFDGSLFIPGSEVRDGEVRLRCHASRDEGKTWQSLGVIARDADPSTDLGDGNLVATKDGKLFAVVRRNHYRGKASSSPVYRIEVFQSGDRGKSWELHSQVVTNRAGSLKPSRGLWAPLLFVTREGDLLCFYDDESTPWLRGFPGHQWLMAKRWNAHRGDWGGPVVVSRAPDSRHLSRDGMAAVAERKDGTLVCILESVQTSPPHAGLLRMVTSRDQGRSWEWARRQVLFEPKDTRFHAFSPWLAALTDGTWVCAFATNEDRRIPGISGTPPRELNLDIKAIWSRDEGKTWSAPEPLYSGTHRNYLPSIVPLESKQGVTARFLATFLDFDRGSLSRVGEVRFGRMDGQVTSTHRR